MGREKEWRLLFGGVCQKKKELKRPGQKHGQRGIPERSKGMGVGVYSAREDPFCGGDKSGAAPGRMLRSRRRQEEVTCSVRSLWDFASGEMTIACSPTMHFHFHFFITVFINGC